MKIASSFSIFSCIYAQIPLCHTKFEDAVCLDYEGSGGGDPGVLNPYGGGACGLYETVFQDLGGGVFVVKHPYNGSICRRSLSLPGCQRFEGFVNGAKNFTGLISHEFKFEGGANFNEISVTLQCKDIDCFDGNNGGCSHFCNSDNSVHFCECPNCWELDGDKTCRPETGRIRTACGPEYMSVDVDKCIFHDKSLLYDEKLNLRWDSWMSDCARFKDNNAGASRSMTTRLDNCGTVVAQEGEEIVFRNKIISGSRFNEYNIVLDNAVELGVECRYNTAASTNTAIIEVESMAVTGGAVGYGSFAFNAQYYNDFTFSIPADSTNVVVVGESLYLAIEPIAIVNGVKWYITDCTIYDDPNNADRTFPIVADRCPNPLIVQTYNSFLNTHSFDMSYTAFQFEFEGGLSSSQAELFLACEITVCLDGNCPSDPTC